MIYTKLREFFKSKTGSKLLPFAKKAYYLFSIFTFRQALIHPVGLVKTPIYTHPYLRRSFSQQGEDLILMRIITNLLQWDRKLKRTYIDVGAFHPIDSSLTYVLYRLGWRGIAFDPSIEAKKAFRFWRKGDTFIRAVVGKNDNKKVDFYVPKGSKDMHNQTSTKYPLIHKKYEKFSCIEVNLNKELDRRGIKKIDFLNLDTERAELEILETIDFTKYSPTIIAVEIHGDDMIKSLEKDVSKLLLRNGYIPVGCAVITYFFVKKDEIPERKIINI